VALVLLPRLFGQNAHRLAVLPHAGPLQLLASGFMSGLPIGSAECDTKVRARAYADLLYMGFLPRDLDPNAAAYWSGVLADPAALPGAIATFIGSSEYLARF
jgi:hypothetical protein